MLKKLLVIFFVLILSFLFFDRLSVFFDEIKSIDASSLQGIFNALKYIAPIILSALIFGFITKHVASTKGYKDGFAWGFFLGIIGLLVVGFRSTIKTESILTPQQKQPPTNLLNQLKDLHDQGILTDEEYTQKKQNILTRL